MSFVIGSSFQPVQEDTENAGRRVKQIGLTRNAPKRAALGVITNQIRVQPRRAAKTGVENIQDENAFPKPAKIFGVQGQENQPFSIFVDQEQSAPLQKPTLKTNRETKSVLTSVSSLLSHQLEPISTAANNAALYADENLESPMVLDSSIEELEEKQPLSREAVITTVPEYADEIYTYLREAELRNRPKANYMKKQQDITNSMRCILVDWLVEVSEEYKLHRETLFLAVNYIDRFLSQMSVQRGKLQLVGAASMFLAAKYEEIYPPDVGEFAYITDDTYTKKQVLRMESLILKVLSFDVAVPTANWFCENFLKECDADEKTKALAMFLVELTMVDSETYLKYLPSVIAASATCLARCALGLEPWPESLRDHSRFEVCNFADCLRDLHQTYCNAQAHPQQAVVDKYKSSKFHEVSNFQQCPPPKTLPFVV